MTCKSEHTNFQISVCELVAVNEKQLLNSVQLKHDLKQSSLFCQSSKCHTAFLVDLMG